MPLVADGDVRLAATGTASKTAPAIHLEDEDDARQDDHISDIVTTNEQMASSDSFLQ